MEATKYDKSRVSDPFRQIPIAPMRETSKKLLSLELLKKKESENFQYNRSGKLALSFLCVLVAFILV